MGQAGTLQFGPDCVVIPGAVRVPNIYMTCWPTVEMKFAKKGRQDLGRAGHVCVLVFLSTKLQAFSTGLKNEACGLLR